MTKRLRINVYGRVQGVGFRPTVYRYAREQELAGWVANTADGVIIEVQGPEENINNFISRLKSLPPPQAELTDISLKAQPLQKEEQFQILASISSAQAKTQISADIATCPDCLRELRDSGDRRYLYPFINCTNCGPRFTIVQGIPYDRKNTTMNGFSMCSQCQSEYDDPGNRRFHAQPNACGQCGPVLSLVARRSSLVACTGKEAVAETVRILSEGRIVAIKGLGGFHLAVDALNEQAVALLRKRKYREDKPFALLAPDIETIKKYCFVSQAEEKLLVSSRRPIVLLKKKPDCRIAGSVAPQNKYLGFLLPYTPLHYLLLNELKVLVLTSGNISAEPIAYENKEAEQRLAKIADYYLTHNRDIYIRCDDSVTRVFRATETEYILRRSRGYVPQPLSAPVSFPQEVLACGAQLKNTFALARGQEVYLSHHIGDLENWETLNSFEQGIEHFKKIFKLKPKLIAHDLHPDYLSTKYALKLRIMGETSEFQTVPVQHHHAHIVSCLADNGLTDRKVIGVALDGTGYGDDGHIWGSEFMVADFAGYERRAHLQYAPLPGGEQAIKEPWRMAVSYLLRAYGEEGLDLIPRFSGSKATLIKQMIEQKLNSPLTCGMGRLFAAVSALLGIREEINYEGQAACELERAINDVATGSYNYQLIKEQDKYIIDPLPVIREIVAELGKGVAGGIIAGRFHNTISALVIDLCQRLREETGIAEVALSGGVWQNMFLLEKVFSGLREKGFTVYLHRQVPANDGGISFGQAVIANARRGICV